MLRLRRRFIHPQQNFPPDHQFRQIFRAGLRRLNRRRHRSAPHHTHRVGDIHNLPQLMGDENDGFAFFTQPP